MDLNKIKNFIPIGSNGGGTRSENQDLISDESGEDDLFGGGGEMSMDEEDDLFGGGGEMSMDGEDVEFEGQEENVFDEKDGGAESNVSGLQSRMNELEEEMGKLASDVSTAREETKTIGEKVEELSDEIDQLLEVYEIVTQGINPFSDGTTLSEQEIEGGFDIFSNNNDDKAGETLDEDLADKDAEEFFDEDIDEIDAEKGLDDDMDEFEKELNNENNEEKNQNMEDPEDKFKQMKEELEEKGDIDIEGKDTQKQPKMEDEPESEEINETETEKIEKENIGETTEPVEKEHEKEEETDDAEVYLETIKGSYLNEVIALYWMDIIIKQVGYKKVGELLDVYTEMNWISEKAKEELKTRSSTLPDINDGKEKLKVEDHIRSLLFILKLSGRDFDTEEISELEDEVTEIASYPGEILDLDNYPYKKK